MTFTIPSIESAGFRWQIVAAARRLFGSLAESVAIELKALAGGGVSFFSALGAGEGAQQDVGTKAGAGDDRERLNRETEALLTKHKNAILSFAYTYVASLEDAEDVLQDTMIAYMVNRPEFANDAHAKAWLMKTARNLCLNKIRYNRYRRHDVIDEVMEETLAAPETEKMPEVLEAVRKLPENMREAIYLFYWEGYSTAQIALILGRRETTVRSDMSRARARLKNILREEFDFG